jgi:dihydroorotate dehydrogenase
MSPEQAKEMMDAGASLVEIYSGFIYEGPALIKNINKHLENTNK